jgi:HEAT repeat protein
MIESPNQAHPVGAAKIPIPDYSAMESLGEFGGDAKAAVPALLRLLGHAQSNVRQYATNALQNIRG